MIKGNGALPEIWVLHEITEDSTGTRDGSYNDFPPSFLPLSHYHGQWPWLSRDGAPEGEAPSDGSGDGRWGYEPYYHRSGGAPKAGRNGGGKPDHVTDYYLKSQRILNPVLKRNCKKHDSKNDPQTAKKGQCSSHNECCSKNCRAMVSRFCDPKSTVCVDKEDLDLPELYCTKKATEAMWKHSNNKNS